jgi:hypothetical protein
VGLADEIVKHALGDFELGDDAVAQRAHDQDMRGRFAAHLFRFLAIGDRTARLLLNRRVRRLVDDNALAAHTDQGVGRAEVDADVERKEAQ